MTRFSLTSGAWGVAVATALSLGAASCATSTPPQAGPTPPPAATASQPAAPEAPQRAAADPAEGEAAAQSESAAVGDLLVAPTRLVFEGNRRSAEVTLVNIGPTAATYRISLIHLAMNEAGELEEIEEPPPGMKIADSLLRFSPRQVRLEPNVAQTVRIQLRKPADLAPGEYRSHMLFRAVPPPEALASDPEEQPNQEGLSIRLIPIYGVSIPVIVRQQTGDSAASLSHLDLKPPADRFSVGSLSLRIERSGDESVYGNLKVLHRSPAGETQEVGYVGGVAVYTPILSRAVRIPLRPVEGIDLSRGTLVVTYTGEPPEEVRLAQAELALP